MSTEIKKNYNIIIIIIMIIIAMVIIIIIIEILIIIKLGTDKVKKSFRLIFFV